MAEGHDPECQSPMCRGCTSPRPKEPLTSPDLVRDLLAALRENEWLQQYERCRMGCCGEWRTACTSCDADQGDYKSDDYQKHKPDCQLAALIRRAEAFIAIEDQLAEERGQMEVAHV